jgi:hypothetical protein
VIGTTDFMNIRHENADIKNKKLSPSSRTCIRFDGVWKKITSFLSVIKQITSAQTQAA